jgi:hypothetical protein
VVFRDLWKSMVPSKVLAFSWTSFLDRISTKVNLSRRHSLGVEDSKRCVFCDSEDETLTIYFLIVG